MIFLFVFYPLALAGPDSSNTGEKFSVKFQTGAPKKVINNQVEISLEINMFGRAELSFKGVMGIQLEPTSAYRHHSINNVGRGDNLYMKLNDSTIYLLHISNLWKNEMEIEFSLLAKDAISIQNNQGGGASPILYQSGDEELRNRLTLYIVGIFPQGQFKDIDLNYSTSGFAEFGIGGGVGYTYQVSKHYEVGGLVLYTHNSLNESRIYYEILGVGGDKNNSTLDIKDITIKAWDLVWILGEGGYTGHILPFLNFYVRGEAGMMLGYAPEVTSLIGNSAKSYLVGSSTAFAYGASLGFRESEKIDVGIRFLNATGTFRKRDQSSTNNLMNFQVVLGFIL